MTAKPWLASFVLASVTACGGAPATGPAASCAEVVRIHRDLQGGVAVVGEPLQRTERTVEIRYEGTDAMNLPVEGTAACTFAAGEAGGLMLSEAIVDGSPLETREIDAIRGRLGHEY